MQVVKQQPANQKEEGGILQVLTGYLAYWPLFLVLFLVSIGFAFLYLRYLAIPKYEASATIIIKDQKKGADDSKMMESLDLVNGKKIIENEIEVLQSRTLLNAVVNKLHLYAPVRQMEEFKTVAAYPNSPVLIEALHPESLKYQEAPIAIRFNKNKTAVVLNNSFEAALNEWVTTLYGVLKFTVNDKYDAPVDKQPSFIFNLAPTKYASASILSDLKVGASSKLSSVLDLSYKDETPQRAEDILNALIAAYGESALQEKNTLAKNTLSFIEARLDIVSKDLDSIERRLQQYKAGRGAVDISRQGQLYLENVSANDKRLTDLSIQMNVLDQLEKNAANPDKVDMLPTTLGINDPGLIQQMNNLSTLQLQYDKLKTTVAENNPLLVGVREQINQIKPTILSNIQSQRRSLASQRGNLSSTGGMMNNAISSIPQKERELIEISRDQNIKNGIYSFLLQKREESELSYASTISDSKVINFAQAGNNPVSPKKPIVYILALVFAICCPVAIVAAKDSLSPKILYRHEIEALTTVPVIGEIAYKVANEPRLVQPKIRSYLAEEFRRIRVSLLSLGIDAKHKKILITSSISGEGKSFTAANLATSISLTGKKVILVDLDLHNPGLGKFLGIKEQPGVSDYLMGKNKIEEIILNINGNENLFFIAAGTLQKDASELLENGKIKTLIYQLDSDFDMVVIDTAPIVLITDAYLLSQLCDATLYVVRHKISPRMLIKRIDENRSVNPIKNPAIIFNGVKKRGFINNNYGYGYSYVYSYETKKSKKNMEKIASNGQA